MKRGFTIIEVLIVIAIMAILSTIIMTGLRSYQKSQALRTDTDLIVETLRQARAQTLASKNSQQYGVHFGPTAITLFSGNTYSAGAADNVVYPLQAPDTIVNISIGSGGNTVVFKRLTGETSPGVVVIASTSNWQMKYVTIYATGLIESN